MVDAEQAKRLFKGVEINAGVVLPARSFYKELADNMKYGESVVLNGKKSCRLARILRETGFKKARRKCGEDEYRVWKLEDGE